MFKKAVILYLLQIYRAILPIAFTPLILSIIGEDRYGMIAFLLMLIGLLGLLDAGVGGAFVRLFAVNAAKIVSFKGAISVYWKVFIVFSSIAVMIYYGFLFEAEYIIIEWLHTTIEHQEALYSIESIGLILSITYVKTFLISFLNGMERQVMVSLSSSIYSTLFYFGSYASLLYFGSSLQNFFYILRIIATLDLFIILLLCIVVYINHKKLLYINDETGKLSKLGDTVRSKVSLGNVMKFSGQLSALSMIWVLSTQVDKFVLSSIISLSEYGKYQMANQLCATVALLGAPITQMLLPRLTGLYAANDRSKFAFIFTVSMVSFTILVIPLMPYFYFFGDNVIAIWLGDYELASQINIYAVWLISAAVINSIMNFLFICLYATGALKAHVFAYAAYSVITIPLSIFFANVYGPVVSAKFLFVHSLLFLTVWGGWKMHKLFSGLLYVLIIVISGVFIYSSAVLYAFTELLPSDKSSITYSLLPVVVGLVSLLIFVLSFKHNLINLLKSVNLRN